MGKACRKAGKPESLWNVDRMMRKQFYLEQLWHGQVVCLGLARFKRQRSQVDNLILVQWKPGSLDRVFSLHTVKLTLLRAQLCEF